MTLSGNSVQTPDGDAFQLTAKLMKKSVLNCDWPLVPLLQATDQ